KVGVDPLGPENILGLCPGLFTGTATPFSGRYMVCGKSPLTGGWGNANSGGTFGPEIKKVGYDGIFFEGKAEKPSYLFIDGENIQLIDASEIWGKDGIETEKYIEKIHGPRVKVAWIGPAGENLSLISGIANDSGRIGARSGLGAVMGSKKLKAVCIRRSKESGNLEIYDKLGLMNYIKQYLSKFKEMAKKGFMTRIISNMGSFAPIMRIFKMGTTSFDSPSMSKMIIQMFSTTQLGTTAANVISSQMGDSPVKNFKGIGYKDFPMKSARKFNGKKIKKLMKTQYGCFSCPARCGAILEYKALPYAEKETHRPEYETCASLGPLILNDDLDLLIKANELLNRAGMDSISAGVVIAFVYECCEYGLLTGKDFKCESYPEGFLPKWGENAYLLQILEMMIHREGIGDNLADGVQKASEKIPGSENYAMHANNQEIPMHDARMDPMLAVTYIADPTPGRHTAATLNMDKMGVKYFLDELGTFEIKDENDLGILQAKNAKFKQTIEANGMCILALNMGAYPYLEIIQAITGWDVSINELLETGHRIQTLRQMFNAREGAIHHYIAQRAIGSPPLDKGPLKDKSYDVELIAQDYYEAMGYEKNGLPKKETLKLLDLDFTLSDLANTKGVSDILENEYLCDLYKFGCIEIALKIKSNLNNNIFAKYRECKTLLKLF
ncbi:MAG: aldehyde ferredoxin oxidoreductase C-terminal domain-containing protein, partial [Candidatus Lokiarchaeota archaeon]